MSPNAVLDAGIQIASALQAAQQAGSGSVLMSDMLY